MFLTHVLAVKVVYKRVVVNFALIFSLRFTLVYRSIYRVTSAKKAELVVLQWGAGQVSVVVFRFRRALFLCA